MAKDDDLDLDVEAAAPKKSGKSKLIIIVVAVVLLLGVSVTATLFLTGMLGGDEAVAEEGAADGAKAGAKAKKDKAAKKVKAPLNYVPLDPPFVVNFADDSEARFLQVTVELGTRDTEVIDQIKEHRPAIRNNLVMLFSSQDPVSLNSREGKEKLRSDTLAEVQKVLKAETGEAGVEAVFFTSFVMQ
ncbi:MAG TPA: hypothetical protein ENK12_02445 [Gammaproteobacteria bacterium]|nr:hypothetical protein [Gammaproteobacteria bacterium]